MRLDLLDWFGYETVSTQKWGQNQFAEWILSNCMQCNQYNLSSDKIAYLDIVSIIYLIKYETLNTLEVISQHEKYASSKQKHILKRPFVFHKKNPQ